VPQPRQKFDAVSRPGMWCKTARLTSASKRTQRRTASHPGKKIGEDERGGDAGMVRRGHARVGQQRSLLSRPRTALPPASPRKTKRPLPHPRSRTLKPVSR